MKIFTVVGARPNFIKIDPELKQTIVHTGQHYDYQMSQVFFKELKLPKPKWNLGCKGEEMGKMVDKLTKLFKKEKPNMVIVFGDTNSSLAGALAASRCLIQVAHIESGMRSYRSDMPEEINRILIDKIARIKFCPNYSAYQNLLKEGITDNVFVVGDSEFQAMSRFLPIPQSKNYKKYLLLTLHRNFNVDNADNIRSIFEALKKNEEKVIFPIHPRTEKNIKKFKIKIPSIIKITKPTSYKEMLTLISNARMALTDSGGVQREAFWMNVPVIILREETEWIEIPAAGGGILTGSDTLNIIRALQEFKGKINPPPLLDTNKLIKEILYRYV